MPTQDNQFLVVAYDIVSDRRRDRVVKILKGYGERVNYSVFECTIKKAHVRRLKEKILSLINTREDSVLFYHLCWTCVEKRETSGNMDSRKKETGNIII